MTLGLVLEVVMSLLGHEKVSSLQEQLRTTHLVLAHVCG